MEVRGIIRYIQTTSKKTPVKVYLNVTEPIKFEDSKVFGEGNSFVVFDDYGSITPVLEAGAEKTIEIEIKTAARYNAVPLLGIKEVNACIESGAIIRDQVSIDNNAVIMMRAIINIGAIIDEDTIIDMGVVLGGRATVGKNCHISAGAVLTDAVEPVSAKPVITGDGVLMGTDAAIVEDVRIGRDVVVAVGAMILEDVSAGTVVGGIPTRVLKISDDQTEENTALITALHE